MAREAVQQGVNARLERVSSPAAKSGRGQMTVEELVL